MRKAEAKAGSLMGRSDDAGGHYHLLEEGESILCVAGSMRTHEGHGHHLQTGNFPFNIRQDLSDGQKCPEVGRATLQKSQQLILVCQGCCNKNATEWTQNTTDWVA